MCANHDAFMYEAFSWQLAVHLEEYPFLLMLVAVCAVALPKRSFGEASCIELEPDGGTSLCLDSSAPAQR